MAVPTEARAAAQVNPERRRLEMRVVLPDRRGLLPGSENTTRQQRLGGERSGLDLASPASPVEVFTKTDERPLVLTEFDVSGVSGLVTTDTKVGRTGCGYQSTCGSRDNGCEN